MSKEFKKFSSIGQFRNVVHTVRHQHDYKGKDENGDAIFLHDADYPKLNFQGTVKLHGTNAAIGYDADGNVWTQSRNRLLTTEKHSTNDNAGFAHFVATRSEEVLSIIKCRNVLLFGEWCGGSIQKSVALNQLPNMFVLFAARSLVTERWMTEDIFGSFDDDDIDALNEESVYLISQFPMYEIEIDFEHPELSQNKLAELTKEVGDCCPVAKTFGVEGIGEGIVWKCTDPDYNDSGHWFKVKDERHQASKVKTLAPMDIEKVRSIEEFVDNTVTRNRLLQGIEYLREMKIYIEMKSTSHFLKWVFNDIIKEDGDTMIENGLTRKDVGSAVARKAKVFWMQVVNEEAGL